MRAFALTGFWVAPEIIDIPVPEPAEGEVRVRVRAASVNGFDLSVASGRLKDMMEHRFPVVLGVALGKDFAGTVDAVGPGVADHDPGVGGPVRFGLQHQFEVAERVVADEYPP